MKNNLRFLKLKSNSKGLKKNINLPNINHLTRIISYIIDINIPVTYTKISEDTGIVHQLKSSLIWLTNNNILLIINNHKKEYIINPRWLELKRERII